MKSFPGRLGIVQRVLPSYRAAFFDLLAGQAKGGLSVFAGEARPSESIKSAENLELAQHSMANNLHLFGGPLYLCWQGGLMAWLKNWNPDALIVEANPRYLSTGQAVRWMQAHGRPVLAWGLGAQRQSGPLSGLRSARRRAFLGQFDALIAYSQRGAEEYRALGFRDKKVFVAPNAVAGRPTGSAPHRPAKFSGPATLLFVGRLQERKGADRLLKACATLPEELRPRLLIVGEGSARQNLETQANEIYPQTEFLGGRFGAELDKVFAEADLFVLPGTGGLAVQEAMTHALPIIVAQGDGTQEDLVSSANGWLLPQNDLEALTRAIQEALSNPAKLRAKGRESFRLVKERYNLETMIEVFIDALQQVTA